MSSQPASQPHSAEYFGEQRNFWWNSDFIATCAQRWKLGTCKALLDVGCGIGHWTRVLMPHLATNAAVTGVDAEAAWVQQASAMAEQAELGQRVSFRQARVERLPFNDGSFDVVTCQTLLIHVPDVRLALNEMLRVLKPGGRLCLAEPNNLTRSLATADVVEGADVDQILQLVRLQLMCERGKKALGKGHNSVGECLPELLHELGVQDIDVRVSDKAFSLIPPYSTPAEQAELAQSQAWSGREFWIWDRPETREYFLAGGGSAAEFSELWRVAMRAQNDFMQQVRQQRAFRAGGVVAYLIAGIKKAS